MANRRFIDFPIATTVGDNDIILIWQSGMNKQTTKATLLNGLPENLEDLLDVNITGLTNGQILRYDSVTGKWENTDQGNLDLDDLNDVTIVSPTNGQVLVYNSSTSKWENSSAGFVPYTGAISTVNLGAQTIQAGSFVKAGGTSSQFLKADGSVDSTAYGTGSVTSVGLTMPSAFNVANSPVTTSGTLAVTGAGTVGQYIRGDGSLADFPSSTGGGSSVSYYLNGSVSQGTIGGVDYKELSKTPILGTGTNFTINANGYIAQFLTDAGDPNLLEIPGGNWNFETYFSASSGGGSPTFYVELYKYDGSTFTLIASNSGNPELIAFGTNVTSYFSTLAVPTTALTLTDRLAIRYYVTHSGRTITLHTENNHLCQIITTFTTGLTALNGLTAQVQYFAVGTSGTDFNISSATQTHTFNLPTASASNRGALSSADWSTFNAKQNALTLTTTGSSGASTLVGATLNVPTYTLSGLGGVPTSRQLTINGTAFDLSADRSWNVGTVTSVGLSSATSGVTIGNTPVTGSGTITLAIATATSTQQGLLSSTDWTTFNNKQNAITLTTTGTSGAATLIGATLNIPQYQAAGTYVTSVTASSPLASSGGTTPNITIQQASGSQSGFLSSTDWTTFNNKQNALTNPVTGTGTTNYLTKFTGSTTVGNSQVFDNGTNVGIGTTSPVYTLDVRGRIYAGTALLIGESGSGYSLIESTGGNGIWLRPNGVSSPSGMFINTSGNVGIGTSSPSYKLQIRNDVAASTSLEPISLGLYNNSDGGAAIYFQNAVGGQSKISFGVESTGAGTDDSYLGFSTGANTSLTERMRITSSGNVGIGTSSFPASTYKFVVRQGTDRNIAFAEQSNELSIEAYNDLVNANVPLRIYSTKTQLLNGNLLVGTTSDNGAKLQVSGAATFSSSVTAANFNAVSSNAFIIINDTSGNAAGQFQFQNNGIQKWNFATQATSNDLGLYNNGGTNSFNLYIKHSTGNVGIGTSSPSEKLDVIGGGLAAGNGTIRTGITYSSIGLMGTFTNHDLGILTNGTERLRITSGGNVGIGTSSPNARLSLGNQVSAQKFLMYDNNDNFKYGLGIQTDEFRQFYPSNGRLVFGTVSTSDGSTFTERMRITSDGNVLIGTTTDVAGANLNVNGNIRTAAPTGGNAANWRLGTARAGTITPNAIVRIEIAGVLVDLDARYV